MTQTGQWTSTDPDTQQYGRHLYDRMFEFKQPDINEGKPVVINLDRYTNEQIEDCINSYGYTLYGERKYIRNIDELYGPESEWVKAECLFEMEEKPTL